MTMAAPRDHGGWLDAAVARWGGTRAGWLDLSTGINPLPYPLPAFTNDDWTALPDAAAFAALETAARAFWDVPERAMVLPAPGASALIAKMPALARGRRVDIPAPTYNEHAAAFAAQGWEVGAQNADARVLVHPNNPDGRVWQMPDTPAPFTVIDESFCDVMPAHSLIARAADPRVVVLKSFGKFWGLAGLRLGFAIGQPATLAPLADAIGPWAVYGPALRTGTAALRDTGWATATRARLAADAARLDAVVGAPVVGGTDLFRLYDVGDAPAWQAARAKAHVWSRIFPYSDRWVRLGLPGSSAQWAHLEAAL
jgi:cobalamin biosynthetic protein CobC